MNSIAVKTEGLKKTFGNVEVIKSCSMHVKPKTIYGFLGENGAGKTTVFKLLSGILTPTSGTVEIFGMDIRTNRNDILRSIGTLIETPIFYEHLSAADNLKLHLAYMDVKGYSVDETLTMVGLAKYGKLPVSKYSLGMRQRLAIARAICHKPRLLILDEPINGLDPTGIKEMRELFKNFVQKENMTILLSSHILTELEQLADTIGFIANGQLVQEISSDELKKLDVINLEDYFMKMTGGTKRVSIN